MSATQSGVVNPRNEMLAEIAASRQASLATELAESGDNIDVLMQPDVESAGEVEKQAEEKAEEKPEEVKTETLVERLKLKVDGQEKEVDKDKVLEAGIRALQKEGAADKRLEEATRMYKDAQALMDQIKAAPSKDVQPGSQEDAMTNAVKAIQYGSVDEAKAALAGLISQPTNKGLTEEQMTARVADMLEFRDAKKWFEKEYADIAGDPVLRKLAGDAEKAARMAGDVRPYQELYAEVGNSLRDWVKEKFPQPETTTASREERKASVKTIPVAAGRQQAPAAPKVKSPSEVIDDMRKARHQT